MALGHFGRCRPRSAAAYVLPRDFQHGLQSDLQMAATCVGLRGTKDRPSYELRLAGPSDQPWGLLRLDAISEI